MTRPLPGRLVLLGHPVTHSLSPRFQNAALRAAGIPLRYEALDVHPLQLSETLARLVHERAAGNVTIPHKEAVASMCATLTPLAQQVGAVNTFWVDETGALAGDNTDVAGFEALATALGVPRAAGVVALLGSGGAAAAVCAAVATWPGARVQLTARSAVRAHTLAARFPEVVRLVADVDAALAGADVVVNATPVGMRDDDHPVAPARLPRDVRVMDLVYRPGETCWVRDARAAGHPALDGLEMLLQQGAAAFERWLQVSPSLAVMRDAVSRQAEE